MTSPKRVPSTQTYLLTWGHYWFCFPLTTMWPSSMQHQKLTNLSYPTHWWSRPLFSVWLQWRVVSNYQQRLSHQNFTWSHFSENFKTQMFYFLQLHTRIQHRLTIQLQVLLTAVTSYLCNNGQQAINLIIENITLYCTHYFSGYDFNHALTKQQQQLMSKSWCWCLTSDLFSFTLAICPQTEQCITNLPTPAHKTMIRSQVARMLWLVCVWITFNNLYRNWLHKPLSEWTSTKYHNMYKTWN